MLSKLLGSKHAAEILLFLLVNRKCYPSQVARCLNLPLTPVQKACERLERAGILVSYYEGRTKLFQWNNAYPLLSELEKLLQRTFSLLPSEKKEKYPFIEASSLPLRMKCKNPYAVLYEFWQRLKSVKNAAAKVGKQDSGQIEFHGESKVHVKHQHNTLIFEEDGSWKAQDSRVIQYRNKLRWGFHPSTCLISLEHLRFGENHPVFMFYLYPKSGRLLESTSSHLCGDDTYFGKLNLESSFLKLVWKALGPDKNEYIEYIYS
ncbi:MAG: hypothetical protein Tsb0015_14520 [Simkaniaceae bacterium]